MQKAIYNKNTGLWAMGYQCKDKICMLANNMKPKRHFIYAKQKRKLNADAIIEHQQTHHAKSHITAKKLDSLVGRDYSSTTFEQLHKEVLNELGAMNEDNHETLRAQSTAFIQSDRTGANYIPPFWQHRYDLITHQMVIDWYKELQSYMLQNLNLHNKAFNDSTFVKIDNAVNRISKLASKNYNLAILRDERVKLHVSDIKKSLKANKLRVEGAPQPFNPHLVARLVEKVLYVANYQDVTFRPLAEFLQMTFHFLTRASETCGIQLPDVKNGLVHIQRQTTYYSESDVFADYDKPTGVVTKVTKGKRNRFAPVSTEMQIFFDQVALEYDTGERTEDVFGNQSIWQDDSRVPRTANWFRYELSDRFLKKYGEEFMNETGQEFTKSLHSLRHAGASIMTAETKDIELVSKILGHVDSTLLSRTYNHAIEERIRNAPDMSQLTKGVMLTD